jgi:hypothetical protein
MLLMARKASAVKIHGDVAYHPLDADNLSVPTIRGTDVRFHCIPACDDSKEGSGGVSRSLKQRVKFQTINPMSVQG